MTLPSDVLASVSVRDPAGTKVAVWEDVPLDQGVRSFSFTLSPGAALGRWRLQVAVEDASFGADLNVSLAGPDEAWSWGWGWSWARSMAAQPQQQQQQQQQAPEATAAAPVDVPEVAMAEEHFVELRFGNGMRRVYKPNMPFIGKVEAVSSERSVRVRIKLYDNTTAIYSQDVEISSGEATFVVPSIMADSSRITMQAELVSVEGKEIESHYVLAREDIYRWNSTSQCFLLVEGVERTMQVGEEARVRVLSTCPCRQDLHYVVTTQGRVTYWSDEQGSARQTVDGGGAACQTNVSFTVDATMAPISRLLVYYVTAGGEPVSDVTTFDVRLVDKRMSVSFEQKPSWAPGETMDVAVLAEDNSLVCLVGGRVPDGGRPASAAESSPSESRPSSRAVDFLDAGLSLYERQCFALGGGVRFHQARADGASPLQGGALDALSALRRLQLDQLWMWHCFNYTNKVASDGVEVSVPEGAGQWTLWGLSLSPTSGLRFSDASTFTVFRPLGVDFRLPRSLRVGEVLEVGVKIANNLNSCVDVSAVLSLKDGAHFQSSGLGFVSERLRLGPHGATSLVVRVQATAQSANNLTAEVVAHAASSCQAPAVYGPEADATARVVRSAPFRVQPEGLTRVHTESAYFCANERVMISTSENFRFDFVPAPRNREAVVLEVRAGQGARVALSDQMAPTDWMYQVVIGDADNTISWIGRGKHEYSVHLSSAKTPGILSSVKERTFWVSWEQNTVRFGRGAIVGKDILLKWRLVKKMKVNFVGFASSWGQSADFRVWNFNDEAGYSQVLHLDVPRSVVPGSERGTLLVAGGMALPGAGAGHARVASVSGANANPAAASPSQQPQDAAGAADDIGLQQPLHAVGHDAAEGSSLAATVSAFAPLPGLRHLSSNSSSSAEYQRRVLDALRLRLQDLVAFLHPDGSFGDHKSHGSHRSTVTILELLTEAQAYFSVDAELVAATKRWVQSRQEADGSFAPPLADMRDAAEDARRDSEAVVRARYFLERHLYAPRGPVALAALCLALVRSNSDVAAAALARIRAASVNQEGDFSWPAQQQAPPASWQDDTLQQEPSRRREPLRREYLWHLRAPAGAGVGRPARLACATGRGLPTQQAPVRLTAASPLCPHSERGRVPRLPLRPADVLLPPGPERGRARGQVPVLPGAPA
ncbi:hypothetical protein ONE63_007882 [Megalurothrips usitatus]|uniref:C3 and PZP-like alpha-2-macroglobulin domain-containing protein 8 n=1 Tax=Megalurothrips usitatus TaxID=439358 RepID=A0AAV7XWN8_9NEOP|nr:hypothetical protein ONE63_007882 [Megalurothrips usitatus]